MQALPARFVEQHLAAPHVVVVQHAEIEQQLALAAVARRILGPLLLGAATGDFFAHRLQRHVGEAEPSFQHIGPKRLIRRHAH